VCRVQVDMLSVQNSRKEKHLPKNKQDARHKYVEMLNQDNNNQDEKRYILKTHMERNENLTCEHDIDAKKEKQRHPKIHRKL